MTHSLGFIFTYLSPLIQREAHDNYKRRFWNWKAYSLTSSSSILSPIPPLKILIWTHMCGTLVFLFLLATLYFWRISFNCAHQNHTSSMLNWFCLVYVSIWIWEKLCMRTSSRATSEYPTVSSGRIGLERLSRLEFASGYSKCSLLWSSLYPILFGSLLIIPRLARLCILINRVSNGICSIPTKPNSICIIDTGSRHLIPWCYSFYF